MSSNKRKFDGSADELKKLHEEHLHTLTQYYDYCEKTGAFVRAKIVQKQLELYGALADSKGFDVPATDVINYIIKERKRRKNMHMMGLIGTDKEKVPGGRGNFSAQKDKTLAQIGVKLGFTLIYLESMSKTAKLQLLVIYVMGLEPGSEIPSMYMTRLLTRCEERALEVGVLATHGGAPALEAVLLVQDKGIVGWDTISDEGEKTGKYNTPGYYKLTDYNGTKKKFESIEYVAPIEKDTVGIPMFDQKKPLPEKDCIDDSGEWRLDYCYHPHKAMLSREDGFVGWPCHQFWSGHPNPGGKKMKTQIPGLTLFEMPEAQKAKRGKPKSRIGSARASASTTPVGSRVQSEDEDESEEEPEEAPPGWGSSN
jgi:hypothetical protein